MGQIKMSNKNSPNGGVFNVCRRLESDQRPNAYETFALPLSYAGLYGEHGNIKRKPHPLTRKPGDQKIVAEAGIGPASGAYEAPEITISPLRDVRGLY